MPSSISPLPARIDVSSPVSGIRATSRGLGMNPSPVTGITFPSPVDPSPIEPPPAVRHRPLRRMSRIESSSSSSKRNVIEISSDVLTLPQVEDAAAVDDLWATLRLEKELKMNKERAKVKSLEEYKPMSIEYHSPRPASRSKISDHGRSPARKSLSPTPSPPSAALPERQSLLDDVLSRDRDSVFRTPSPAQPKLKKKKSITLFRPSPDGRMVAIFDLKGVHKDDIRVTLHREGHLIVSWEKWEVEDWEEEDCIARRTVERVYHRVILVAQGTKFQDIYGTMKGEDLLLRYPPVGFDASRSGES
ncbi:hypothetical protein B0H10DRAFT_2025044 [Mycena sp. CBHHK59/15]|nr:hypothetical protein B0H10DRAFT_2025044 [Mycena sp. CBHHK59/15]